MLLIFAEVEKESPQMFGVIRTESPFSFRSWDFRAALAWLDWLMKNMKSI
jgi:hypothetical protein